MESYEIEREKEQKEVKENILRLEKIAEALGFTVEKSNNEEKYFSAYVRGTRKDGGRLYLSANIYGFKGRIVADISTPRLRDESIKTPGKITISLLKDDEKIISDIKKRLIPALDVAMKEFNERKQKIEGAEKRQDNLIEKAALMLEIEPNKADRERNRKPSIDFYNHGEGILRSFDIKTDYNGTEARIELTIKAEGIADLCQVLKQFKN